MEYFKTWNRIKGGAWPDLEHRHRGCEALEMCRKTGNGAGAEVKPDRL
jgi:hypothetical protein